MFAGLRGSVSQTKSATVEFGAAAPIHRQSEKHSSIALQLKSQHGKDTCHWLFEVASEAQLS